MKHHEGTKDTKQAASLRIEAADSELAILGGTPSQPSAMDPLPRSPKRKLRETAASRSTRRIPGVQVRGRRA
ncbi:MAG: hypothetical protein EBS83_10350 [Planctomycetia bacterium]|nr:hypothetical protein [Planctomycetia bacterium]